MMMLFSFRNETVCNICNICKVSVHVNESIVATQPQKNIRKVQRCKQVCDSSMTTTVVMLFVFINCNKKPNKMN